MWLGDITVHFQLFCSSELQYCEDSDMHRFQLKNHFYSATTKHEISKRLGKIKLCPHLHHLPSDIERAQEY